MKVRFVEKYAKLEDMEAGDCAVSKDRREFFICGLHYDNLKNKNVKVILNVNNLNNQYVKDVDMSQDVKILEKGDSFLCNA